MSDVLSMRVGHVAAPVRRQVVEALRSAILSGSLPPGERLVETDLCRQLGVSRPPVREAIRQLETEGLIELAPRRGSIVARHSRKDVADIYEARGVLEAFAARLFAEHATDRQVGLLEQVVDSLGRAYAAGNLDDALAAKRRFYDVLLWGAGNDTIRSMIHNLNDRVAPLHRISLSSPERAARSLKEVRAILAAIKRRKPDRAAAVALRHAREAAAAVSRILERADARTP